MTAIRLLPILLLAALPLRARDPAPVLLGRTPVPGIAWIGSGSYVSGDIDDLLVLQELGECRLSLRPALGPAGMRFTRLVLLRLFEDRFQPVWSSGPLLASVVPRPGLGPNAWTPADLDGDGLLELLVFAAGSCAVWHFDSLRAETVAVPGSWVFDAVACDLDGDTRPEIATLELSPTDSTLESRLVRVYRATAAGLEPASGYITGLDWTGEITTGFIGSARFEDYAGTLPVVAGTHRQPRPGVYAVLYLPGEDSFAFTDRPFPLADWFSKDRVLPAGPLSLTNVGDTLVAYGYFVPGSRVSGPPESFAALQDGEWRLLEIRDRSRRIVSPLCRFTRDNVPGWLELRDDIFRFHPGEVFTW